MPFVVITAAALPSRRDELDACSAIADAVAGGLGLRASDVQVSCVYAGVGVLGADEVDPWPVVVVHGVLRPRDRMQDALARTRAAVAAAWGRREDEVWVQWAATP